jgi:dipeptidyl aminopeptidase/acylaminoacyl peptidase
MKIEPRSTHRDLTTYVVLAAIGLLLALTPFVLTAQGTQPPQAAKPTQAAPAVPATKPAATPQAAPATPAAPTKAPLSPVDQLLQQETYAAPPPELAEAVLAPRHLNIALSSPSPDKKWFLNEIGDGPVPMATFSKPFHELGGVFIDFKANRARPLTIRNNVGIQLISAADGSKKQIEIMAPPAPGAKKPATPPPAYRVSNATWSPDGKTIAFFVHTDDATHIWVADVANGKSRQMTTRPVLATLVSSIEFTSNGRQIATVLVPDNRPPMPQAPQAPAGPQVKLSEDTERNRLRTFPSLMSTEYELRLLEWHVTGQLALIDVQAGPVDPKARAAKGAPVKGVTKIGQPSMIRSLAASPDGKYVRVTRATKPFSYIVPVSNFGSIEEIWDGDGKALAKLTDRPLNEGTQDDTAPDPAAGGGRGGAQAEQGKREIAWRADGQGLTYLEQEPAPAGETPAGGGRAAGGGRVGGGRAAAAGGDQASGAGRGQAPQRKDRLYQWLPPFEEKGAKVIFENNTRMTNHRFTPDMQTVFWRETSGQNTVEYAVSLNAPTQKYTLVRFRTDDQAASPGSIVMQRGGGGGGRGGGAPAGGGRGGGGGAGGGIVLLSADGSSVFYQGTINDKNPEQVGPKSFIKKVAIKTGDSKAIYEGDNNGVYESVVTPIDLDAGTFIVERQSPTQVPQYFLVEGSNRKQLTENKDLFPDLTAAPELRIPVERADGFKFKVTVMLPPGYKEGTKLPALFWFYPREFANQEAFDQPDRTFNKNTFTNYNARSMQFLVRQGYAVVVDSPALPIVGPVGQQNNNYVNDLRNDLAAVIDELDRRAIIDRTRLAIGGHSYGAFTTVNAMVHTPFFKAGIAGDGAYNRTLTPIGFQSERRDLWEAPNVYLGMSPFLSANNLTGALLMYHGLGDQNVGTDPDNSIRLFHALNGLGKPVAMYLYPLEDHGPASRETLLDLWARWAAWLDKYVKNPQKVEKKTVPATSSGPGGN